MDINFNIDDFCNLRVFTDYSLFQSIIKLDKLLKYCFKKQIKYVGICEKMNIFGFVEFSKLCKSHKIKPIFGCLLKVENIGLIPVYIKNQEGYEFLSYVLSQYAIKDLSFIPLSMLQEQKGLICLAGGEESAFYHNQNKEEVKNYIEDLKKIFKSDLFIEIQPRKGRQLLLSLAQEMSIPIVCTNPTKFIAKEDFEKFYVFECMGENKRYSKEEFESHMDRNGYLHNGQSMASLFDIDLHEGIINSGIIAKKCNFIIKEEKPRVPKYQENGETDENIILEKKTYEGLKKRLENVPESLHQMYFDRVEKELKVLQGKNFSGYFLVTADFVSKAKEMGVPVGPARGSGGGSLVAYALTIIDIDPIKYGLIFERFLNPERNSMPDFDIDFCPKGREMVIEYLRKKYGYYNILQIVTFGTLQAKGAIRDVCRVFNLSFRESDSISRLIPHDQINPVKLQQAIDLIPELKKMSESPKYFKIFQLALELEGNIRNTSKHAAGIIISDKPIWEFCAIYKDDKGDLSVCYDLQDIEYVGGIKFDFLGLKTLTVIHEATRMIEKNHGVKIDFSNIPTDDQKTFELFRKGDLDGVFQFDGAGIRDIVMQLKPDNLEDLIVLNALYRPGPLKSIPDYIRRKHKVDQVKYLHPLTEKPLEKTFGVMVYQEQVMEIAKVCAGYTDGEADSLRRAMGKKKPEEMEKNKKKFISGAKEKGIDEETADKIFEQMNEFSGYGFNKSHSAPYALIAYVCGYLKTHYPGEFFCSFLSEEMSSTEKVIRFLLNAKKFNFEILPPSVNKSFNEFTLEDSRSIRYGLGALKNLGEGIIEEIVKNRKQPYENIHDFVSKNNALLAKKSWESLVFSGALDDFNQDRWILAENLSNLKTLSVIDNNYQKFDYFTKLELEKKIFGFNFNNFVEPLEETLKQLKCGNTKQITSRRDNCIFVGEILQIRRRRTKDKTFYAFVEVMDHYGLIYLAIFSKVLEKHSNKMLEGAMLAFVLNIEKKSENLKCVVQDILTIDELLQKPHIVRATLQNKSDFMAIKSKTETKTGTSTLIINFVDNLDESMEIQFDDSLEFRKMCDKSNFLLH